MKFNLIQSRRFRILIFGFFGILFLVLLSCYAYKGFFSRYLQDDHCYGYTIRDLGFVKGVVDSYFYTAKFNGNRYSLTLFAGFAEVILGTKFQSIFALLSLLIWLVFLSFFIYEVLPKIKTTYSILLASLTSSILVIFSLYSAPDVYQALYWRNSSLTYLYPLIFTILLIAWAFYLSRKKEVSWFSYPLSFGAGIIVAGFSEVGAVWLITLLALILIIHVIYLRTKKIIFVNNGLFITILLGAIFGAILLIISPVNAAQLNASSVRISGFSTLVVKSFSLGFYFLKDSISGKWLPFFILFLFGFGFIQVYGGEKIGLNAWIKRVSLIVICLYLLCVASMMPSVLVRTAYPDPRALLIPHFSLIVAIFLLGLITGGMISIRSLFHSSNLVINTGMVILILVLAIYTGRMVPIVLSDVPSLRARAIAWDQRQELILQEKSAGQTHIIVPAFDNIDVINELHPEENNWVNQCVARYYQVDGISAIENYDGVKPYFK